MIVNFLLGSDALDILVNFTNQEPGSSVPAPAPVEPDVEMEPGVPTPAIATYK